MHMNWRVIVGVELEFVPKYDKNCRHLYLVFAKLGNKFITCKYLFVFFVGVPQKMLPRGRVIPRGGIFIYKI